MDLWNELYFILSEKWAVGVMGCRNNRLSEQWYAPELCIWLVSHNHFCIWCNSSIWTVYLRVIAIFRFLHFVSFLNLCRNFPALDTWIRCVSWNISIMQEQQKNATLLEQFQNPIENSWRHNPHPNSKIHDRSLSWLGTGTSLLLHIVDLKILVLFHDSLHFSHSISKLRIFIDHVNRLIGSWLTSNEQYFCNIHF